MRTFLVLICISISISVSSATEKIELAVFTDFYECFVTSEGPTGEQCMLWIDYEPNTFFEVGKEIVLNHSQLEREITTKVLLTKNTNRNKEFFYTLTASSYEGGNLIVQPKEYNFASIKELRGGLSYGPIIIISKERYLKPFLYVSQPWVSED